MPSECRQVINPLADADWNQRLLATPHASIFHTHNWFRVLQDTYGYQPYYVAALQGDTFAELLPMMEVRSRWTGVRGVSLPFADDCAPLCSAASHRSAWPECGRDDTGHPLFDNAVSIARQRRWQYLELRGGEAMFPDAAPSAVFYRHRLALHRDDEKLFAGLRSNYRARVRKAQQHELTVEFLRTPEAMAAYYRLHCLTRQRHGVPPQPMRFFANIQQHIIAEQLGVVGLVSHQGQYIAGAVFFCFGDQALYKFGASDMRFQHLLANFLLFWRAIQRFAQAGYNELGFGKTTLNNQGLIQFKDGWGTAKHLMHYYRYNPGTNAFVAADHAPSDAGSNIWKRMPLPLLRLAGRVIYPHVG